MLSDMSLLAVLGDLVSLVEVVLRLQPIPLVEADVRHAEEALKLHSHGFEIPGDADAF